MMSAITNRNKEEEKTQNRISSPLTFSEEAFNAHPENAERILKRATTHHLIYSLCGLILGAVCIIGGLVLFLRGVTGATSWTAKIIGSESNITDAASWGRVVYRWTIYSFNHEICC
jgi:hypothetical protein